MHHRLDRSECAPSEANDLPAGSPCVAQNQPYRTGYRHYRQPMGIGRRQWHSTTPHVDELVRRLSMDGGAVDDMYVRSSGAVTVTWSARGLDHPVVLSLREDELASIVDDFAEDGGTDLWPEAERQASGFNLLLVHLDEVLMTRDTTDVIRLTRDGLQWPTAPRDGYPP